MIIHFYSKFILYVFSAYFKQFAIIDFLTLFYLNSEVRLLFVIKPITTYFIANTRFLIFERLNETNWCTSHWM